MNKSRDARTRVENLSTVFAESSTSRDRISECRGEKKDADQSWVLVKQLLVADIIEYCWELC